MNVLPKCVKNIYGIFTDTKNAPHTVEYSRDISMLIFAASR